MSAADQSTYRHRQGEPALRGLLLTLFVVMAIAAASMVVASKAAGDLRCPSWLFGTKRVVRMCMATPVTGIAWNVRYEVLVRPSVRRFIATLPNHKRIALFGAIRFYNAASIASAFVIGILGIVVYVMMGSLIKPVRPKLHGTRFWATTDQVLATGLAVGNRPPWWRRLLSGRSPK